MSATKYVLYDLGDILSLSLVHHLDEEESDILAPLQAKLSRQAQLQLAQQFVEAERLASSKPHPELSDKADKAPEESIRVGLAEKHGAL